MTQSLAVGYSPLVDAAPLIVAREFGFAEEEGLSLDLHRAASWSMLRDMLDHGQVMAAQMLSVVPVARALELGGGAQPLEATMVLSLNGQVLGVSGEVAGAMGQIGFDSPKEAGQALARLGRTLRIGVPFPFSMQAELLHYWLERAAPGVSVEIRTVPPSHMAAKLLAGEIDGFCVGEPWGSHAVETAGARLLLSGAAIWSQAPEKVLASRTGWAEAEPDLAGGLMRAVWRAGRWMEEAQNRITLAEILARPDYLNVASDLIDRALTGQLLTSALGLESQVPQFLTFHAGLANFPWRSQAGWIGTRLAQRFHLPEIPSVERARAVFRSDLYRQMLAPLGAPMPRSSDRVEGILEAAERFPGVSGSLILERNRFFDGQIFDPALPA
jgi:two-component system, oxyanion-binding sensor